MNLQKLSDTALHDAIGLARFDRYLHAKPARREAAKAEHLALLAEQTRRRDLLKQEQSA